MHLRIFFNDRNEKKAAIAHDSHILEVPYTTIVYGKCALKMFC